MTQPGNTSVTTLPSTSMPIENPIIPRTFDTDLDIPIAIRKGVRSCTTHPIAQYLSYHRLSSNYKAFTSKISHLFIPRNIQEALRHPNWKLADMEELNALNKIKLGKLLIYQKGRKLLVVNGY